MFSADQLDLSATLDGALDEGYRTEDGTDTRGYGGLDGPDSARALDGGGARILCPVPGYDRHFTASARQPDSRGHRFHRTSA